MKKTILITGSTDGIGKLTAMKLAKEGHEVYLHGRNSEKLDKVILELKSATSNENIYGFIADFSDLRAVKKMAEVIKKETGHLDILINNAGVYKSAASKTYANLDIRFAVNYFAPVVLTAALIPLLRKGNNPRIINLSSAAQAPVSLDALVGKEELSTQAAYAQSKLALTMWSRYLAEKEPTITVIAVNPGSLLNTKMVKEGWGFHQSSADKGRDILFDLATAEKYNEASGKYFDNDRGAFGSMHPAGNNKLVITKLMDKTNRILDQI